MDEWIDILSIAIEPERKLGSWHFTTKLQITYYMTYTRKLLNRIGCCNPDCDHQNDDALYLHANCHPGYPPWLYYEKQTGEGYV